MIEIQNFAWDCYEQMYTMNVVNRKEMGKSLEMYTLSRSTCEGTENLSTPIISLSVRRSFYCKTSPGLPNFSVES